MIQEIHQKTGTPVIAGGLINTPEEVERAVSSGAAYITTSDKSLW